MDLGVRGRNFVIVGGTTGMGFAAATALAGDGANVALLARDGERARERADGARRRTRRAGRGIAADGTSATAISPRLSTGPRPSSDRYVDWPSRPAR